MKNSVMIRKKMDDLGRVVIPKDFRKQLGITIKEELEVYVKGKSVIIQKPTTCCNICNGNDNLHEFEGQLYCGNCIQKLSQILVS